MNVQPSQTASVKILSSNWDGINPHLLAKFYPVKRAANGTDWLRSFDKRTVSAADNFVVDDGYEVWAPITDGTQEMSLNWTSPFEGAGAESKVPSISAMLQSGTLSPDLIAMFSRTPAASDATKVLSDVTGRTGITKLNSTQIFSGMPPVKFSFTAHFRALIDPNTEVRQPVTQLEQWAVPQYLANDGVIAGALKNGLRGVGLETIYPSVTPQLLAMKYGDQTILPIVIESVSKPFTVPRSTDGEALNVAVQITVATLTAIDRRDVAGSYNHG
ncbi:hypothetical protein [Pandoraea bronchicola]|uniref:Uncharacterized protein n=1 Tax=Pandoraea bronchicola TaxID=2508287 RepID=A0A5E5BVK8_9BURK|nr:hypothetical protein [Pandoraea bronchicola]VVE88403.1 hypothetical protein PBR20603_02358 [Pandoraea bronchicola]